MPTKTQKLHLVDLSYFGDFAFKNAADANRFTNLLAKAIPVKWDYADGDSYHHIQTEDENQISFTLKLNQSIDLRKRPEIEILEDDDPDLLGLPAPRKGLPAPLIALPAPKK